MASEDAVIVIAQAPRMTPHAAAMRTNLSTVLRTPEKRITVRATTTDHLGFIGRGEGIACLATALTM